MYSLEIDTYILLLTFYSNSINSINSISVIIISSSHVEIIISSIITSIQYDHSSI
jgi:hypothetical protein